MVIDEGAIVDKAGFSTAIFETLLFHGGCEGQATPFTRFKRRVETENPIVILFIGLFGPRALNGEGVDLQVAIKLHMHFAQRRICAVFKPIDAIGHQAMLMGVNIDIKGHVEDPRLSDLFKS